MVIGIVGSGPLSQETRIGKKAASSGDGDMAWFTGAENRLRASPHTIVPLLATNLNEALRDGHVFCACFL
jgi:hypothetical protein